MDELVEILSSQSLNSEKNAVISATQNVDRLISDWNYAANTSNQSKYASSTLALATLLGFSTFPKELAAQLCRKIVQDEIKTIYRALTGLRQNQTVPTLSLLKQIAGSIPHDLVLQFDFTLRVIPKLLSQQPYRQHFLEFYIILIQSTSPQTRRELLANRKIFSGWIGKLGQDDSEAMILNTLELLYSCVLKDNVAFTKTTKMGLFNDWTLKNFQRILSVTRSDKVSEQLSRFIIVLLCDRKYGVRLPGEHRLALSFLKIVKPWENTTQMDLVIRILKEMQDLVVPYFDGLAIAYPLTPKQSMWWFSYATLHIRVLKLDASIESIQQPKTDLASLQVLPKTINKQVLQQCLQFDSRLINFLAVQIMLFAVRKLTKVVREIYEPAKWETQSLLDHVLNRLPDFAQLTKFEQPPLLRITALTVLKEVCQISPLQNSIALPLEAKEVQGLDLVEAENILEVQTFTSDQTKWWSPQQGQRSLFTQLCQFAVFNYELSKKCSRLLQHLVNPTQMFSDMNTLAHPIDAVLYALSLHNCALIWNMIDQAVQRVVRSPYKYIDEVRTDKVSPFIVAVIEQFHFLSKEADSSEITEARTWLSFLITSLDVLGEDSHILQKLVGETETHKSSSDEYFHFVLYASDSQLLDRKDLVFKISNHLELAATLHRALRTTNGKLQNHLLASIPLELHNDLIKSSVAFGPFINGSFDQCQTFLEALDLRTKVREEDDSVLGSFRDAIEQSSHWVLGLSVVSTDFLLQKLSEKGNSSSIVRELNFREHKIDLQVVNTILNANVSDDVYHQLSVNLNLWDPTTLDNDLGLNLLQKGGSHPEFVASIVRACGLFIPSHPLSLNPEVLVAASKFAPEQVDAKNALDTAVSLLKQDSAYALPILAGFGHHIQPSSFIWELLAEFIENCKHQAKSVIFPDLLRLIVDNVAFLPSFYGRWLKIVVHQVTKQLAEDVIADFDFVNQLCEAICGNKELNPWNYVHHNSINALLEAALRYNKNNVAIYKLVSCLSFLNSAKQETLAQLTILFETRKSDDCTIDEAISIHFLFFNDVNRNSTIEVEQAVLMRYTGSLSAQDRMLLSVLEEIESVRQRSWVDQVETWDVRPAIQSAHLESIDQYNLEPLVAQRNGKLAVTLDEKRIRTTIQVYEITPKWQITPHLGYNDLLVAIDQYAVEAPEVAGQMYDSWFLLSLIISCDYLFENMEVLLNSGLLSFLSCCLSNQDLAEPTLQVLKHIFVKLGGETEFSDKVGIKLVVGKLLMMNSTCRQQGVQLPSHIPSIVGQVALVLSKPTHFLHEKVCQWLLASPEIQPYDVPLFKSIVESSSDMKMREMQWLVNSLKSGVVDANAAETYIKYGVMEWCLSQLELLGDRTDPLKEAIYKLFNRMEEVSGVSSLLITKSGVLTTKVLNWRLLYSAGSDEVVKWAAS